MRASTNKTQDDTELPKDASVVVQGMGPNVSLQGGRITDDIEAIYRVYRSMWDLLKRRTRDTKTMKQVQVQQVEYRGGEPTISWRESGKPFEKATPSLDRDSNLDLRVLGSLAQQESSALANYAIEAEESFFLTLTPGPSALTHHCNRRHERLYSPQIVKYVNPSFIWPQKLDLESWQIFFSVDDLGGLGVRNATAAFIINLSVSDLMFCCFNLPLAASMFWQRAWRHGELLCQLFPLLRYGLVAVSLFTVLAITINRYVMIGHPRMYPKLYRKKYLGLMVACTWMFGFGALIATWVGVWGRFGLDRCIGSCSILPDDLGRSPKEFLFVVAFLIPCLAIVVCYARIFYIVRKTALKSRVTTRMIFASFVVCYLPITLTKTFHSTIDNQALNVAGYLLIYLSTCINPIIYVVMSSEYRQAYKNLLVCKGYGAEMNPQQNAQGGVQGRGGSQRA
uniref:(California timema) hypothetical protein n=1 Tax=Timema californicum TaxID=61474 RepID=A0A7R9P7Y1_TIMCA|nr:unnamed protein product [Timema californicum]